MSALYLRRVKTHNWQKKKGRPYSESYKIEVFLDKLNQTANEIKEQTPNSEYNFKDFYKKFWSNVEGSINDRVGEDDRSSLGWIRRRPIS